MKRLIKFFVLFISLFSFCSCSEIDPEYSNKNDDIVVKLEESEHYEITSNNPVTIKKGEDATFKVSINDDYEFDDASEGTFENGTYTIKNVKRSRNVSMLVIRKGTFHLTIVNNDNYGTYFVFPLKASYAPNEKININVIPRAGHEFMCYTKTNPYRPDSAWSPSGKPISFVSNYSFEITQDLTIHVNYFSPNNLLRIVYHANGGKTIDNEDAITLDYLIPIQFTSPTTMLGTHYLFREGYTLESYNTKEDGSGQRIGIGSVANINLNINNQIDLFAQWAKWDDYSDFEIEEVENTLTIKKYIGDKKAKYIVVPDEFDGKVITTIASNAFDNCDMTTLIFNEHLEVIKEKAVVNCEYLFDLVIFTNITFVNINSIVSNSLTQIKINQTLYSYSTLSRGRDIAGQIQQLESHQNKVVFFGMSTMRYNHPLDAMKEKWPNKYFYLAGMQGGCNYKMALDIVEKTIKGNDIIVVSLLETSLPPNGGGSATFLYLQYNFDLLLNVNYQNHKDIFFKQFSEYVIETKANQSDGIYLNQQFTQYDVDGLVTWGPETDNPDNVDSSYTPKMSNYLKTEVFSWIEDISNNNHIGDKNILLCWSSYNQNSINDKQQFLDFEEFAISNLPYNTFDSISDNILPGDYFRENDSIHLSMKGGRYRMNKWAISLTGII